MNIIKLMIVTDIISCTAAVATAIIAVVQNDILENILKM